MSGHAFIEATLLDGVLWLRLDRPRAANALNESIQQALVRHLGEAQASDAVRAVVLGSTSERVFCAGADLKEGSELPVIEQSRRRRETLCATLQQVATFGKPLVGLVEGKAIGAGCMLAFLADEIVTGPGASFSLPEITLGMPSPLAASIARFRGDREAVQALVFRGDVLDADACIRRRLTDAMLAGDGAARDGAQTRAIALGQRPGAAYAATKAWSRRALPRTLRAACRESARLATPAGASGTPGAAV